MVQRIPSSSSAPTDQIADILDHEIVASSTGGSTRYLIHWVGKSATKDTWIIEAEFASWMPLFCTVDALHDLDLAASRPYKHRRRP
ncbi:hypothetical protein L3X38_036871 [Prunus dulcis]|uniref:Chromo domain-containing protein n=1 Tax=Prunus dulcis TaxID=3755 RepID=A0AAD4V3J7_PRUDU|nr:hypothetical protein L3X38_036871 [Prunus dulcis]